VNRRAGADTLAGGTGGQIETLQEAFRVLSGAATTVEHASRFRAVVGEYFAGDGVDFFRRAGGRWEPAGEGEVHGETDLPSPAPGSRDAALMDAGNIRLVQNLSDGSALGIRLLRRGTASPYSDSDLITLRLLLTVYDNTLREITARRNEKELIFSLNHRVLQLNSLIDTGIEVASLAGESPPHHLALERAASLTNASRGVSRVLRGDGTAEDVWFPHRASPGAGDGYTHMIESGFAFGGEQYTFQLFDRESRNGVIPFEETDKLLLDALARQVHASLENRFLHREALEKQKIDQDIAVAASIQQRILPASLPVVGGYDIAGVNIPSKSVGGDYYDCIPLADGRLALVIADVAGKGVPAALLVSSFHAYLSAYLEAAVPLVELATRLNRVIAHASTEDKFITAFFALLDPATGSVHSVNAGHNPVFLRRADGAIAELTLGGIPLGMIDMDFPYQSESLVMGNGDRLLLYTDGIPEATDDRQRLYEEDFPLREFVAGHTPGKASAFIDELIADVKKFTGAAPQNDDITALYLVRH